MTRALLQQALDALIASYKDIEFHLSRTKSLDEKDACVARILEQVDAINALRAALAEPQGDDAGDAALWRACKARKDAALAAGFGRSTLRSDAPEEQKT